MTQEDFKFQVERLKSRFGEKNFDLEFVRLVWEETKSMLDIDFVYLINFFIGTKPASRAPLITDFRDGRVAAEKRKLEKDVKGAQGAMNKEWPAGSMRRALDLNPDWRGCKTAQEAVEVEKLKLRVRAIG